MKKSGLLWLCAALMMVAGMGSCSSDEEEYVVIGNGSAVNDPGGITESGLFGKWRFVEMQYGPIGAPQPNPHTMEIRSTENVDGAMRQSGGTIVFTDADDVSDTIRWYCPDDESLFLTDLPVILFHYQFGPDSSYIEIPYGCEVGSTTLKMHYLGISTTEHIPETYIYDRIQ
jgi:hypothetical protein